MIRLYLMPITGIGTRIDPRRPKYKDAILTPDAVVWNMMDYGYRPVCLLAADTTTSIHNSLTGNADVYAFPNGFEAGVSTVGSAVSTLSTTLESYGIPAHWVAPQDTYKSIAHTVGAMFQFAQRLNGIMGNVDPFAGATLSTQFQNLMQATQDATIQAGADFNYNMSGITATTTLRNAIKYMADQWGARPLFLGPFTL